MSEVREGYKMTELGDIPVEWRIVELNEIADVKGGKRLPKGEQLLECDTGLPYIRVSDMDEKGLNVDNIMYVPEHVAPKISNYRIFKNEIYISVAGTLGLIGIVPEELDGANLTENADRICNIKIDNVYLKYYLKSPFIQNAINSVRTTSAQPKLALNQIKSFQILLPTKEEQKKIASILSTADEQINETEQLIVKTKELKKGLMQQLLTKGIGHTEFKQTELGEIPNKWEVLSLGDISERITRKNKGLISENILTISAQHGLVSQTEFFNKKVASSNIEGYYLIEKNEFAYNKSYSKGYPMGAIKSLTRYEKGVVSTLYICFKLNEVSNVKYFSYYFNSNLWHKQVAEIAQEGARNHGLLNVAVSEFFDIKIIFPSLEEQIKIEEILSTVDEQIDIYEQEKTKYEELKKGLMQQLLTGQIRVKI